MDFFFIQMADPQFGMFAGFSGMDDSRILELRQKMGFKIRRAPKTTGFADETRLYEKAIAATNRLNPAFVVMSGDMVQNKDDGSQLAELWRITGQQAIGTWAALPLPRASLSTGKDSARIITLSSMVGASASSLTVRWPSTTPRCHKNGTGRWSSYTPPSVTPKQKGASIY
jgi:hypothetical protein